MVSRTPLRTPLLDINNQTVLNKSIKKTVLSHISAESTTRTPTRKPQKLVTFSFNQMINILFTI